MELFFAQLIRAQRHTLDPSHLLLEACSPHFILPVLLHLCCFILFFFFLLSPPPLLFVKVGDHFSGSGYKDLRHQRCSELPPELTVSINHIARVSAPFISPLTLLLLYLPALFISLFLWKIALFCFSAAHPPAWRWCLRGCGLVVGPSTCVALNFRPPILRRLTTAK